MPESRFAQAVELARLLPEGRRAVMLERLIGVLVPEVVSCPPVAVVEPATTRPLALVPVARPDRLSPTEALARVVAWARINRHRLWSLDAPRSSRPPLGWWPEGGDLLLTRAALLEALGDQESRPLLRAWAEAGVLLRGADREHWTKPARIGDTQHRCYHFSAAALAQV